MPSYAIICHDRVQKGTKGKGMKTLKMQGFAKI